MTEYVVSSHPVWGVLSELGLPPEIINIIFSYKTVFSPLNVVFMEYKNNVYSYEQMRQSKTTIYNDLFKMVVVLFFKNINRSSYKIVSEFIDTNKGCYMKPVMYILDKFIRFHNCKTRTENIGFHYKTLIKEKYKSFLNDSPRNIFELVGNNLKSLLTINFNSNINKLINSKCSRRNTLFYSYLSNRFNTNFIFKNIIFILLHIDKNGKTYRQYYSSNTNYLNIPKSELILFNLMAGISFKKSWTKPKLLQNLMKTEFNNTVELISLCNKCPVYSMENLNEMLDKVHISSIDNKDGSIDFVKTIHKLHTEYEKVCYK